MAKCVELGIASQGYSEEEALANHKEIAFGTLDSILEQARLSKQEFEELVRKA